MELRAREAARLTRPAVAALLAAVALLALGAPAAAAAAPKLVQPANPDAQPRGYGLTAAQAILIADGERSGRVGAEKRRHRGLRPTAYTSGAGRWQVSYFDGKVERAQVVVDDRRRSVLEAWTGAQVQWRMARGYEGAFGRTVNAPYVWLPLCLLFLIPFIDPRRPFRLLHLDLLVLLGFGASHVFFNRGEIGAPVPLAYPVLLYLLARMLWAGFRPRERHDALVPLVPVAWLAVGLLFLVGFRVGLNVTDSNVIDVGYAGVIGADRIADGDGLYGAGFATDNQNGDTYGPVNYLAYVPFEQVWPWSGSWDDLPAAHGAAVAFDLLTLVGLLLLGRRLRPGGEGRALGVVLAFAWASYPYTLFVLESNSNDSLVALLVVLALLGITWAPVRGALVALAAAAKLAPLALAPVLARG